MSNITKNPPSTLSTLLPISILSGSICQRASVSDHSLVDHLLTCNTNTNTIPLKLQNFASAQAWDSDAGVNSQLRYSFVERPGDGSDRFQIEPATGQVVISILIWPDHWFDESDLIWLKGHLNGKFPRAGRCFLPIGGEQTFFIFSQFHSILLYAPVLSTKNHFFLISTPFKYLHQCWEYKSQVRATDQDGAGLSATQTLTVSLFTH